MASRAQQSMLPAAAKTALSTSPVRQFGILRSAGYGVMDLTKVPKQGWMHEA
jgi:hypothetical protein